MMNTTFSDLSSPTRFYADFAGSMMQQSPKFTEGGSVLGKCLGSLVKSARKEGYIQLARVLDDACRCLSPFFFNLVKSLWVPMGEV